MPKGRFTSTGLAYPIFLNATIARNSASEAGLAATGVFVSSLAKPSLIQLFAEFRCRNCGTQEAYRSRPRGVIEKYVLPLLLLRAVRCERCYYRSYVLSTVPTLQRDQPDSKQLRRRPADGSRRDTRVA